MGMTIDEAVTWLNTDDYESKGFADATIVAIDIIHKYQKITEIVKAWREVGLDYDSCDAMENIERTIDNGNDN